MTVIHFVVASSLAACAMGATLTVVGSSSASGGTGGGSMQGTGSILNMGPRPAMPINNGIGSLETDLRLDPPAPVPFGLATSYRGRTDLRKTYFTRTVVDSVRAESAGYEVLLEEQHPGEYLATFGKVVNSPLEISFMTGNKSSPREPVLPEPKLVHDGDVITIEILSNPATGQKLFDDLKIGPRVQQPPAGVVPSVSRVYANIPESQTIPTVEGIARDFTAADAELRLTQPGITLNGTPQTAGLPAPAETGSLLWVYLPGHGRYIFSLAPHPELDFRKAGEVRGGSVSFTLGGDTVTLESYIEIAPGHAPYILYGLHDPLWEPTASSQKGRVATGSVGAGELVKLKNQ